MRIHCTYIVDPSMHIMVSGMAYRCADAGILPSPSELSNNVDMCNILMLDFREARLVHRSGKKV